KNNTPFFRKLTDSQMSEWHKEWQNRFKGFTETEKQFKHKEMTKSYRKADVDLNAKNVIEFQHSTISKEEVFNRKCDYIKSDKNIIWVINGNNSVSITELKHSNRIFLEFTKDDWKYKSFIDYDTIYLNI